MPVSDQLDELAQSIYASLALNFPVCMASDEFYFFPQYRQSDPNWSCWDNFKADALQTVIGRLARWRQQLEEMSGGCSGEDRIDVELLGRVLATLHDQFTHVCWHLTQPTFYLSNAGIGLAEAFEHSPTAFARRAAGLAGFIDGAVENLHKIPALYRDLGLEMTRKMIAWLSSLPLPERDRVSTLDAMGRLAEHLRHIATKADFRLSIDLYAKMADIHMGCRMDLDDIARHLDQEIAEAR